MIKNNNSQCLLAILGNCHQKTIILLKCEKTVISILPFGLHIIKNNNEKETYLHQQLYRRKKEGQEKKWQLEEVK